MSVPVGVGRPSSSSKNKGDIKRTIIPFLSLSPTLTSVECDFEQQDPPTRTLVIIDCGGYIWGMCVI